mmetsp:Transcript_21201/g.44511  ORF Transcript_21201/g.44511 Transcript_21201/m.44511 type:complete len:772 (+) Transcript_21201:522-2837(+)|eukprot:CAMPEP_0171348500 /NCGR_PEP_ID=MMETSP0878-20121228/31025_1 /TAXON_ID=67004 /ORGANISM="Thalassiosira weissflogii, Strain CCMP1336" /LENGTH=771 /DNA_ID=CAMNT_0011852861 /DNA_START=491 /DNA_END=2806 /DNA_ORIENTATION=+
MKRPRRNPAGSNGATAACRLVVTVSVVGGSFAFLVLPESIVAFAPPSRFASRAAIAPSSPVPPTAATRLHSTFETTNDVSAAGANDDGAADRDFETADHAGEDSTNAEFSSLDEATSPDRLDPAAILDATIGPAILREERRKDAATDDVGVAATSATRAVEAPSIPEILRFVVPAIGVWLCSPVLSMIDTASVGLLSGTAQQAALNPAVSVTDYGALVVAFMYTATTNLIAAAQQHDASSSPDSSSTSNSPRTTKTLITALRLALVVGSIFGAFLTLSAKTLIQALIGNDSIDPTVLAAALRYVRIRCLGMPAALVIGTAQSACLGMQDVKSPLYVLLTAAIINFCGDVLLVRNGNPWLGGAAGAAWATVFSQYGALVMFWRWMTDEVKQKPKDHAKRSRKFFYGRGRDDGMPSRTQQLTTRLQPRNYQPSNSVVVDVTQGIMELMGTSKAGKTRRKKFLKFLGSSKLASVYSTNNDPILTVDGVSDDSITTALDFDSNQISNDNKQNKAIRPSPTHPKTRGFLAGQTTLRNFLHLSKIDVPTAKEFLPFVIPVTTTSIGRISGYIAMSHVASSTLGTFDMAAHQIIFSIFCCLTPIPDALSQVAQSFVPGVYELKNKTEERARALKKTVGNFRKCGVGFGAFLVGLVSLIPVLSRYFTNDVEVLARVNGAIPGVGLFLLVNGLMCAGEGTLLGQKDLTFLRNMYAIFFFTVPAYMLRLKHRALTGVQTVGIGTMWAAFSGYNVIRTSIWHLRLAQLQRRTDQSVVEQDSL